MACVYRQGGSPSPALGCEPQPHWPGREQNYWLEEGLWHGSAAPLLTAPVLGHTEGPTTQWSHRALLETDWISSSASGIRQDS